MYEYSRADVPLVWGISGCDALRYLTPVCTQIPTGRVLTYDRENQ